MWQSVTYPLELIKTRLQIQGEAADEKHVKLLKTVPKRGMIKTAAGIVMNEGFFKLWYGIQSGLARQTIYAGIRIGIYKQMRNKFNLYVNNKTAAFPLWQSLSSTVTACVIGQILVNPIELAKTQLQAEGRRRVLGLPPRVHGLVHAIKLAYIKSGFLGLWKGSIPAIQRAILVGIGDLTAYDLSKQYILKNTNLEDTLFVHILGSISAGLVAAILSTPADVVKTRIMNQPLNPDGSGKYYKGVLDCFIISLKAEGPLSLYKGFVPLWMRTTPWALTFWISYEEYSKFIGVAQF